ncbi:MULTISPECIES: (d)CMP kinase [unclassified Clostridioides]|uniref:(d)CMP kinase n=1 Tax=unclassified Clostridioides TaxID=2635829 RepID=UPI001D11939C|nr:(d)CMP kinase [Clostridioides sp. ZZV15-6388]MCC0643170.1 (d)CMP kinase [Clostridioides sp. ZZV14-6150]MCC0665278.1 (d)CMP kinase [Clostridioides sp. ZZV15-6597]MCC0719991.1 (d)CMP kinase [Clostridioides sp. ZZV14-6105]MCC0723673.1 (d)CMP kinase [Clostridioides sp. ZZV14-6104]MCC0728285.1 (d)CMP kinase [Clostridioides sp. ZZV14-6045]MCC0732326.1 (d)CMP kinase [Clostridioides sp. ZZV14-6048]MCC0734659.1 (d)CMP kinase [Clostridioides sp. ZZV14-6009]MCC0738582.1 (d)CMP kinase [Clostridioide
MSNLIIAVDGPAGAGKSTIAKIVAEKLNINYIDTGAMYRAVTYKCLKNNIDVNNEKEVIKIAENSDIDFKNNSIYLDQKIINEEIRTIEVSNNVSNVAKIKEVRKLMVEVQRKIGTKSSVILDGRDIGSYVFPNADYKFFLVATPEERGSRRYKELCNKGYNTTLKEVIEDIVKRDEIDSNREFAPLVKADDALEIDTTGKTIEQVVQEVVSKISF